jgi:quinone-modifying oxidoreductase, subunit QmoC
MTQPYRFEPDLDFIRDVMKSGGDSVKKCFQCATCSVVCPLAPDDKPFPRKEMIQAQWGLKDKLVKDPDIWLCHNCNDCSTYCPRGAKPGDVLNALRKQAIAHYSVPRVLAQRVGNPKSLPWLLAIPAALFMLVILFTNHFGEASVVLHGETVQLDGLIRSWKMIPMLAVDTIFILTALFAVGVFAVGITRFWKDLDSQHARQMGVIPAAVEVIQEILLHRNFKECGTSQSRYLGHLGIFYGFVALFIVTTCVFVGIYFLNLVVHIPLTPWPLWNPIKLFANLGAIALLTGCFLVIRERLREDQDSTSSYYDWLLLGLVLAVAATGFLAEIDRWVGFGPLYYVLYFVHLVCVWALFAYSPYTKLAHIVYRTVALIHAKASGRYLMQRSPVVPVSGKAGGTVAP